ncbi:MAG: hypothetical protein ABJC26_15965 [Gemmatimonadaceae bacterium]
MGRVDDVERKVKRKHYLILVLLAVAPFAIFAAVESRHDPGDPVLKKMKREDSILIASAETGIRARVASSQEVKFTKVHAFHAGDTVWVCGHYNARSTDGKWNGARMFVAMGDSVVTREDRAQSFSDYFEKWCKTPMVVRIPAATSVTK